jgi:hypothetical protein
MESRRLRLARHVARIGDIRVSSSFYSEIFENKDNFGNLDVWMF